MFSRCLGEPKAAFAIEPRDSGRGRAGFAAHFDGFPCLQTGQNWHCPNVSEAFDRVLSGGANRTSLDKTMAPVWLPQADLPMATPAAHTIQPGRLLLLVGFGRR